MANTIHRAKRVDDDARKRDTDEAANAVEFRSCERGYLSQEDLACKGLFYQFRLCLALASNAVHRDGGRADGEEWSSGALRAAVFVGAIRFLFG